MIAASLLAAAQPAAAPRPASAEFAVEGRKQLGIGLEGSVG